MTHHLFLARNPSFLREEFRVSTIHAIGRLSQQPTGQSKICNVKCEISPAAPADLFMRNKPNLCVFWAVSGDCEEKQSQFKPNSKPISPHKTAKIPCSTFNCSTALLSQAKGLPQTQSNPIPYRLLGCILYSCTTFFG